MRFRDDYSSYDDLARFEYGRMLWRDPLWRDRLRNHWLDLRHPYRERFRERQQLVEALLGDERSSLDDIDASLRDQGTSLRATIREIPPVFGSFFGERRESKRLASKQYSVVPPEE